MQVHDAITAMLQCKIGMITDQKPNWDQPLVTEHGNELLLGEVLNMVASEHMPKALLDYVGSESLRERVPWAYLQNLIACNLATKLVYKEGIEYAEKLVAQDDNKIADIVFRYCRLAILMKS